MPPGQQFITFELYDFLADLVPGATLITVILFLFPSYFQNIDLPPGFGVFILVIVSFVGGRAVHTLAETRRKRTTFGDTLDSLRGKTDDDPPIEVTEIEEDFWDNFTTKFDLDNNYEGNFRIVRLLRSYLETTATNRAAKFQIVWTFSRNIWAVGYLSLGLSVAALGIKYVTQTSSRSYVQIGIVALFALGTIILFSRQEEKFDDLFVKYLFSDFYTAISEETTEQSK